MCRRDVDTNMKPYLLILAVAASCFIAGLNTGIDLGLGKSAETQRGAKLSEIERQRDWHIAMMNKAADMVKFERACGEFSENNSREFVSRVQAWKGQEAFWYRKIFEDTGKIFALIKRIDLGEHDSDAYREQAATVGKTP